MPLPPRNTKQHKKKDCAKKHISTQSLPHKNMKNLNKTSWFSRCKDKSNNQKTAVTFLINIFLFSGENNEAANIAASYYKLYTLLLMHITQQIVHRLDRIKCHKRHLNKYSVPIAHSTIPQTGQLHSFELATVL